MGQKPWYALVNIDSWDFWIIHGCSSPKMVSKESIAAVDPWPCDHHVSFLIPDESDDTRRTTIPVYLSRECGWEILS